MLMRFGWVASLLAVVSVCFWTSCGGSYSSSTPASSATTAMYVAAQGSGQVFGFRSAASNGVLSGINGSPYAAGSDASAIVVDPNHTFALVLSPTDPDTANQVTGTISRYTINADGSLAGVTPKQDVLRTGSAVVGPVAMAMDSAGKFLFVANQGIPNDPTTSGISVFSIGSNAGLTEVPGSPFVFLPSANPVLISSTTSDAVALAAAPGGSHFLYVVNASVPNQANGQVSIFQFDGTTGALSTVTGQPGLQVGTTPAAVAISPGGEFLFVPNFGSNNVDAFTIAGSGGLTPIVGEPFPAQLGPTAAAVDPSGQFLYVVDQNSNQVSGYRITPVNGKLTPLSSSPYSTGIAPVSIAISPTNKYLYVSNNAANTISGYSIDPASGNIGPIQGAVSTGTSPAGIAFGK